MSKPGFFRRLVTGPFGKIVAGLVVVVLLVLVAFVVDLNRTPACDIREFDANEVARLDTAMWRSYYDRQKLLLFRQLTELLRTQYRFSYSKSNTVAYHAAKAAFVFKDGHNRAEYERALPELQAFYREIQSISSRPFDADQVAKLELEWWIIHRERAKHQGGELEGALADAAGAIYQMPPERFAEHARLRAEAMHIRDAKAAQGGVTEADWKRIDELLHQSWQSLWKAVHTS
ncbi:MAG: hypothetical protein K1Y36_14740 [Blastocatellia bacterium]|nr:hypothetical protein [Blastocatellia bacterium]